MKPELFNECYHNLKRMRLSGMAEEFRKQEEDVNSSLLSAEERIERLIRAESQLRDDKKLTRIIKKAGLRYPDAFLDDQAILNQGVDPDLLHRLSECSWIDAGRNLLITGKTGAGKSYCACALGIAAASQFRSVRYIKASELLRSLETAEYSRQMSQELQRYGKYDLLIIDDFGLMNLSSANCRNLFELIDLRDGRKSTVFVSQLPVCEWYDLFKENTYADACLDRLTSKNSYRIEFNGESLRH